MDGIDPPHIVLHPASRTPYEVHFAAGPLHGVTVGKIDFNGALTLAFDATGAAAAYSPDAASLSPLTHGSIELTSGQSTLTLTIEPFTGAINIR